MNRLLAIVACLVLCSCDESQHSRSISTPVPTNAIAQVAQWGSGTKSTIDPSKVFTDNWYIVMDGSGSMGDDDCSSHQRGGRIVDAKIGIQRFVDRLPANANVGLFLFDNNYVEERVPLGSGEANRNSLNKAITAVRAGGSTPLGPSIDKGFAALQAQAAKQGGYGTYHLIVETDGQPDSFSEMEQAVDRVTMSPIVLETIGFCIAEKHPLNQPGKTIYRNAMDPASLDKGLDAILAETDAYSDDKAGSP